MSIDRVSFRDIRADEAVLVFSFLTIAARMTEAGEPIQKALVDPGLVAYWRDWGRAGDRGIVAVEDATSLPVSCAFVRMHGEGERAYGYVADDLPELTTGTIESWRGRGVGTRTLSALIERLRGEVPGLSLSVRTENPAMRLYQRLGFREIPGSRMMNRVGTESVRMLLRY